LRRRDGHIPFWLAHEGARANAIPGPSEIEIRPLYEYEDFGEAMTAGTDRAGGAVAMVRSARSVGSRAVSTALTYIIQNASICALNWSY